MKTLSDYISFRNDLSDYECMYNWDDNIKHLILTPEEIDEDLHERARNILHTLNLKGSLCEVDVSKIEDEVLQGEVMYLSNQFELNR